VQVHFRYAGFLIAFILASIMAHNAYGQAKFRVNHNPHSVELLQDFNDPLLYGQSTVIDAEAQSGHNVAKINRTELLSDPHSLVFMSIAGENSVLMVSADGHEEWLKSTVTDFEAEPSLYPLTIGGVYTPVSSGASGHSGGQSNLPSWEGLADAQVEDEEDEIIFVVSNPVATEIVAITSEGGELVFMLSADKLIERIEDEIENQLVDEVKDKIKDAYEIVNPVARYKKLIEIVWAPGLEIAISDTRVTLEATIQYTVDGETHEETVTASKTEVVENTLLIMGNPSDAGGMERSFRENLANTLRDLDQKIENRIQDIRDDHSN